MRLISLMDLKVFLEVVAVTEHDSILDMLIDSTSQRIVTWLNRDIKKEARTLYRDVGKRYYYLPAYPVDLTAALSVVNDGTTLTKDSDFFVWDDDGLIEIRWPEYLSFVNPRQLVITYTGGYAETPISEVVGDDGKNYTCILSHLSAAANKPKNGADYATYWSQTGSAGVTWVAGALYNNKAFFHVNDDIKLATIIQAAFTFRRRKDIGVTSVSFTDGSTSKQVPLKLLGEVQDLLRPHRRRPEVK